MRRGLTGAVEKQSREAEPGNKRHGQAGSPPHEKASDSITRQYPVHHFTEDGLPQ